MMMMMMMMRDPVFKCLLSQSSPRASRHLEEKQSRSRLSLMDPQSDRYFVEMQKEKKGQGARLPLTHIAIY